MVIFVYRPLRVDDGALDGALEAAAVAETPCDGKRVRRGADWDAVADAARLLFLGRTSAPTSSELPFEDAAAFVACFFGVGVGVERGPALTMAPS